MRRVTILVSVLIVMLLGGLSVATAAQEGTPPAEEGGPEGVTFEPLGFGVSEEVPATPVDFGLARVVIDPGAGFAREGEAVSLLYVESGALTLQMDAPFEVTRAATTTGVVEAGTEVTLEAGDTAVIPPNVAGEIRNDGEEPVVYLAAFVVTFEEEGATPAA